jgi:hypothetical protein
LVSFELNVPRQQFFDPVHWVLGAAIQNVPQVGLWIQSIQLGRSGQAVDRSRALSPGIGRQFIVPEFWAMKLQLHTLFILSPSNALSLWASMSTTVHLMFSFAMLRKQDTCSRSG